MQSFTTDKSFRMRLSKFSTAAILISCLMTVHAPHGVAQDRPDLGEEVLPMAPADTLARVEEFAVQSEPPAWHEMITNVPGDLGRSFQTTFRPNSLPTIAGIAGITGALMVFDHETYSASKHFFQTSPSVRSASYFIVHVGDGRTQLGSAGAFALYGFIAGDSRALRTGSQLIESFLASGLVVQVLKRVTGRESPAVATRNEGTWRFFPNPKKYQKFQSRYYAFPSGHIASTMSMVTVIAENYPDVGWIKPVGYSVVGLLGVSLVNVGYHWYSDLPLGIALGYAFGHLVSHRADAVAPDEDRSAKISLAPSIQPYGAGLAMVVSF